MAGNNRTAKEWRWKIRAGSIFRESISKEQVKKAIEATGLPVTLNELEWKSSRKRDHGTLRTGDAMDFLYDRINNSWSHYARAVEITERPTLKQFKREVEVASAAARRLIDSLGLSDVYRREMNPTQLYDALPALFRELFGQTIRDGGPLQNGIAELIGYIPKPDFGRDLYGLLTLHKALESAAADDERLSNAIWYAGGPKAPRSPTNLLVADLADLYMRVFNRKPTQDNKSGRSTPFVRFVMATRPPSATLNSKQIGEALRSVTVDPWFPLGRGRRTRNTSASRRGTTGKNC